MESESEEEGPSINKIHVHLCKLSYSKIYSKSSIESLERIHCCCYNELLVIFLVRNHFGERLDHKTYQIAVKASGYDDEGS